MNMSLDQYIVNPMGRNNAVLNATAREAIRSNYKKKYETIMLREHGNLQYFLYKDEKNNVYVAHFKIPSETISNFYYDVVFEFFADENIVEGGRNLFKYNCKFFSNDPAFVYTYAFVFNHEDLIIPELRSKMSKTALRKKAVEKNPGNNIGYVKTIYFAYLYMISRQMNNINTFKALAVTMSKRNLRSNVEEADVKIQKRQEAGEKLKEQDKKKKQRAERIKAKQPEIAKVNNTVNGRFKHTITGKINSKVGNIGKITRSRSNRTKK